jgi:phthalate 4,5-dioxygenase
MMSAEDNKELTRVGPGTKMGSLLRRFWFPALLSAELPIADSGPIRLKLLGESLIAFRDDKGRVGILDERCPHRQASLFYGRFEDGGVRCAYHGWMFDAAGKCLDIPNERTGKRFKESIQQRAYPTREIAGLVWVYMGPPESCTEPANFEWTLVPETQRVVAKWFHDSNWLQAMEGEIDSSHISFLHSSPPGATSGAGHEVATLAQVNKTADRAPRIFAGATPYGMVSAARRRAEGQSRYWWRLTHWIIPGFSLVPSPAWPMGGRIFVPIDEVSSWAFSFFYHPERSLTREESIRLGSGLTFPPRLIEGSFMPVANASNHYLIDRDAQRQGSYTGIWGVNDQDRAVQESMGAIVDRTLEHLGPSDIAVITARRRLLAAARALADGREPDVEKSWPHFDRLRALDVQSPDEDLGALIGRHGQSIGLQRASVGVIGSPSEPDRRGQAKA